MFIYTVHIHILYFIYNKRHLLMTEVSFKWFKNIKYVFICYITFKK